MLVSVCVPAYRQPDVLLRTVRSVLMQEGCAFELIITDDSDDDSVESVLAQYKADLRVRYSRNSIRLGAIGNWNASLIKAKGDIIKILHHDDWFEEKTALFRSVEPIVSGTATVVFSACRAMSVSGHEMFIHRAQRFQVDEFQRNPAGLAFANLVGPPSVVTLAKSVLVEFDVRYTWLADVEFYVRLLQAARGSVLYLDEPLINVTSDSSAQLSRECEMQKLRCARESILLFVTHSVKSSQAGNVCRYFVQLARGLRVVEALKAIRFAIELGGWRIAMSLFKGVSMKVLTGR